MSNRKEIKITTAEAERQINIIEQLKEIIAKKAKERGKEFCYSLQTFGCQMISKTVMP